MPLKLFPFICCLFFCHAVKSQQPNTDSVAQTQTKSPADSANMVFRKPEITAGFPSGLEAWKKYLGKNLDANIPVRNNAPDGRYQVIIRFIVGKDGSIRDITTVTNHGYGMEQEVIRIIKNSPPWTAAAQAGKPVDSYRRQTVSFFASRRNG